MQPTLAFDIYGTVIDPLGITDLLAEFVGDEAGSLAVNWRQKQFEYLFRRGLGRKYASFTTCTRQALLFSAESAGLEIADGDMERILDGYQHLPAYDDCRPAIESVREAGFRCFALSNGEAATVNTVLSNAGLAPLFDGVVSADEVRSFKPDPSVYGHFLDNTGALLGATWLVSAQPFDVIGALEVGWKAIWVQRSPTQHFDPWDIEPTAVVDSLGALREALA